MNEILIFPDPRLRKIAAPITNVDGSTVKMLDDMLATMYQAPGIGLAANQVDLQLQLVVMDISDEQNQPLFLINPKIIESYGDYQMNEGCLSVPGFFEPVRRKEQVLVSAINRDGEPFEMEAEGLLAVCIQHELDHLQGKLFVDHLSSLKRSRIKASLVKQLRKDRD
jgi:peptide deformylase